MFEFTSKYTNVSHLATDTYKNNTKVTKQYKTIQEKWKYA